MEKSWRTFIRYTQNLDDSISKAHKIREQYRNELLQNNPEIKNNIKRPSKEALSSAQNLILTGTIAAADGTLSPVPLLSGAKIQIGVVIVSNTGDNTSRPTFESVHSKLDCLISLYHLNSTKQNDQRSSDDH